MSPIQLDLATALVVSVGVVECDRIQYRAQCHVFLQRNEENNRTDCEFDHLVFVI